MEPLFKIPWAVWQESADEPLAAELPEFDSSGITQSAAAVERRLRAAKQILDNLTLDRTMVLLLATRAGRTRRELSDATGLSLARVQQIVERPSADAATAIDEFITAITGLVEDPESGLINIAAAGAQLGRDHVEELLAHLNALRLVTAVDDEYAALTEEGRAALVGAGAPRSKSEPKV